MKLFTVLPHSQKSCSHKEGVAWQSGEGTQLRTNRDKASNPLDVINISRPCTMLSTCTCKNAMTMERMLSWQNSEEIPCQC